MEPISLAKADGELARITEESANCSDESRWIRAVLVRHWWVREGSWLAIEKSPSAQAAIPWPPWAEDARFPSGSSGHSERTYPALFQ